MNNFIVYITRDYDDLLIKVNDNDSMRIVNWFTGRADQFAYDAIKCADKMLNKDEILAKVYETSRLQAFKRGIEGLGLDLTKTVYVNGNAYTYTDLFSEKTLIVKDDNGPKEALLLDIFDALGGTTKDSIDDNWYGNKAVAAQQTIACFMGIAETGEMNELTWTKLEDIVIESATKSVDDKLGFRESFKNVYNYRYQQILNSINIEMIINDYNNGQKSIRQDATMQSQ